MIRRLLLIAFAVLLVSRVQVAVAQQVYVSTPLVNTSSSFYEWFGIDWGYQWRGPNSNFFFHRGSSLGAIPAFGGFDPAAAAHLGFSPQGGNHGFYFNLTAAQGSNRAISSTTSSVNVYNGAIGTVSDVQLRPFVTGLIPVVGSSSGYRAAPPTLISPLKQRLARLKEEHAQQAPSPVPPDDAGPADDAITPELVLGPANPPANLTLVSQAGTSNSTAERGDISVVEIRRRQELHAQEEADALRRLIEEAKAAEDVGRFGAARVRYRQAAARATGELQRELLDKLESIRDR